MAPTLVQTQPKEIEKKWVDLGITEAYHTMDADWPEEITGPSAWDGKDLEAHPEKWIYHLTPQDLQDIDQAIQHFNGLKIPLTEISPQTFPLKTFHHFLAKELKNLFHGTGFNLLRGFPVQNYNRHDQIVAMMGIGSYWGSFKPQNGKGHILGHVQDLAEGSTFKAIYDSSDPTTRIYATRKAQPFHVDGTDIVGLLCLSKSASGGLSSLISSHTVYNRLKSLRPDILDLLKQPWLFDRKNEHGPDELGYLAAAPMTYYRNHLFSFWSPHFFGTVDRFPGVVLDDRTKEALDYIQALCEREALTMELEVGDFQFVQNYTNFHARTAYVDTPDQTRHLLRLWLTVNRQEVGWEFHPDQEKFNFDYRYAPPSVPLEAE